MIFLTATVYTLYTLQHLIRHKELAEAFTAQKILHTVIRLVLIADFDFIGAGFLWFLMSLAEAYMLLLVFRKWNLMKAAYLYVSLSLAVEIVAFILCPGEDHITLNVYTVGLRWVLAGHFIAENIEAFSKISLKTLAALAVIGWLAGLIRLTRHFVYVSDVVFNLLPAALFILAVREDTQAVKFPSLPVKIGAKYSLYIYLFHILIRNIYSFVLQRLGINSYRIVYWTTPLAVFMISLALAVVIVKVRNIVSRQKNS